MRCSSIQVPVAVLAVAVALCAVACEDARRGGRSESGEEGVGDDGDGSMGHPEDDDVREGDLLDVTSDGGGRVDPQDAGPIGECRPGEQKCQDNAICRCAVNHYWQCERPCRNPLPSCFVDKLAEGEVAWCGECRVDDHKCQWILPPEMQGPQQPRMACACRSRQWVCRECPSGWLCDDDRPNFGCSIPPP